MAMFKHILTERRGDVLAITLNRPEKLNAALPEMFDEIRAAIGELDGARAVLFEGTGRAFCAGMDLAGDGPPLDPDPGTAAYLSLSAHSHPTMLAIAKLSVPVVSAVRGAAAGIGCSLALAADFCIASETAYFLQAFANIGLVPDGGATWMLPRLVGKSRAMQMMMLGERIPAEQAAEWGMIYRMVPDAELDAEAAALANRLAAGPTLALGMLRQGVARSLETSYADTLEMEAQNQRIARRSADVTEGVTAFLQKRAAKFTGG